jgi:hypothetical protein
MYVFIYLFGKRLSFKDLNILNDDATATKLGKKKKTLETTMLLLLGFRTKCKFHLPIRKKGKTKN